MKIETELTDEEKDVLTMALGIATGLFLKDGKEYMPHAKACVRLMNKLFAQSPDYTPYDERTAFERLRIVSESIH